VPRAELAAPARGGHHRGMAGRRLLALPAAALMAGVVAWALTGLPGSPAACLPADCDCEAPGPRPIQQPANAWSSLAFAAAGIAVLARSSGRRQGEARPPQASAEGATGFPAQSRRRGFTGSLAAGTLVAAGLAAFLYHAALTAWAARLDGIAVVVLAGALALHGFPRIHRHRLPRLRRAGSQTAEQPSEGDKCTARLAAAVAPWFLLILGGLCWWLGQSGGPWCRPDCLLQAHAAWHVLAAGAIGLWLRAEKTRRSGPQPRPTSSLRAERPDTR
jgi:hypothetical protein